MGAKPRARARRYFCLAVVAFTVALLGLALSHFNAARYSETPSTPPRIGDAALDFALCDYAGNEFRLSGFRGRWVLLNFFCGCLPCQVLAREWNRVLHQHPQLTVIAVCTLSEQKAAEFRTETGIKFPLLFDPSYGVAEKYDSVSCPRCWLIDEHGKVLYTNRSAREAPDAIIGSVKRHLVHLAERTNHQ